MARFHLGTIRFRLQIVDVDPHRDYLLPILEISSSMGLEHQVCVARYLPDRSADEACCVFIDHRREGDFHRVPSMFSGIGSTADGRIGQPPVDPLEPVPDKSALGQCASP